VKTENWVNDNFQAVIHVVYLVTDSVPHVSRLGDYRRYVITYFYITINANVPSEDTYLEIYWRDADVKKKKKKKKNFIFLFEDIFYDVPSDVCNADSSYTRGISVWRPVLFIPHFSHTDLVRHSERTYAIGEWIARDAEQRRRVDETVRNARIAT